MTLRIFHAYIPFHFLLLKTIPHTHVTDFLTKCPMGLKCLTYVPQVLTKTHIMNQEGKTNLIEQTQMTC